MKGLGEKKYMHTAKKRFDPFALVLSAVGLFAVLTAVTGVKGAGSLFDIRSILIVGVGTLASLLFQFDFTSFYSSMIIILKSFMGTPEKKVLEITKILNEAIVVGTPISELREGSSIDGELLNDIVYMHNQGLLFEEIDEFVTSRISEEFLTRLVAVNLLNRAAIIAPALGLFGTVVGLVGVLNSLTNPSQIGPSMSLALMTTAYGAGLGSIIFTPLAGRLEHHNAIYMELHKQILSKVAILLNREERRMDKSVSPELDVA